MKVCLSNISTLSSRIQDAAQRIVFEGRRLREPFIPSRRSCFEKRCMLRTAGVEFGDDSIAVLLEHDIRRITIVVCESKIVQMSDASLDAAKALRARSLVH